MSGELIDRLRDCESVIEHGMQTFVEVGTALAEIRDDRLYRADFATFEDYCRERWEWSPRQAYRMIEAADVAEVMRPIGHVPAIANEAQAREVSRIIKAEGVDRAAEVLAEVAEQGPVTAKAIRDAAQPEIVVVDNDTGEIVSVVDDFATDNDAMRRANLRREFSRWITQVGYYHLHDPAEMAAIYPELADMATTLRDGVAAFFDDYLDAIKQTRRPRLVKGN